MSAEVLRPEIKGTPLMHSALDECVVVGETKAPAIPVLGHDDRRVCSAHLPDDSASGMSFAMSAHINLSAE